MVVTGLAPAGVLFGFGVLLIATGLFYGLLIPVQPMKAVLTDSLTSRSSGRLRRSSSTSLILGKMAKVCLLIALPCGALARERVHASSLEDAARVERISWPGRRRCARFEKQSKKIKRCETLCFDGKRF